MGDAGVFACGGVLTATAASARGHQVTALQQARDALGRLEVVFRRRVEPATLQLDLLFNPAQPFSLKRQSF
jgi:hypothetical protein